MTARSLHPYPHLPHLTWAQIEYGVLATLSVGGIVFALLLALARI